MRTERVVEVCNVGYGLGLIIIVPLFLTIIGIVIALPLMMIMHAVNNSSAKQKIKDQLENNLPKFIGAPSKYIDTAVCGVGNNLKELSGSGMAYSEGRLFVCEEGVAAEIPWDSIRSWTWNVEGHESTQLYGRHDVGTTVQVNAANWRARTLAERASGFTVVTADIEKPEWRFQTSDTTVLKKWMEILQQMKEGKLARA